MKKNLLLLCIGLLLSTFSFAQLTANFEDQVVPDASPYNDVAISGWLNHMSEGTRAWQARIYNENKYAQLSAYNSTDASNVAWLITPGLDFTAAGAKALSFDYNSGYDNGFGLAVLYSNNFDGSNVAGATWTDITSSFTIPTNSSSGYGTFASAGSLDVSAYTGTVHFAFRYTGAATGVTTTVQIDNISVTGVTVGIEETMFSTVVYPNPVQNTLNLSEKSNVKVMNIAGQVIIDAENVNSVDMSSLQNGMYIININGTQIEKVIKY